MESKSVSRPRRRALGEIKQQQQLSLSARKQASASTHKDNGMDSLSKPDSIQQESMIIEQYEQSIADNSGPDPLTPWLSYIRWLQTRVAHTPEEEEMRENQLLRVLERCTRQFVDDERYTNSKHYLKVWIFYAERTDAPEDVFAFLAENGIGTRLAIFYQAMALVLENQDRYDEAEQVYLKGIGSGVAEPTESLVQSYSEFKKRVITQTPLKLQKHNSSRVEQYSEDASNDQSESGYQHSYQEQAQSPYQQHPQQQVQRPSQNVFQTPTSSVSAALATPGSGIYVDPERRDDYKAGNTRANGSAKKRSALKQSKQQQQQQQPILTAKQRGYAIAYKEDIIKGGFGEELSFEEARAAARGLLHMKPAIEVELQPAAAAAATAPAGGQQPHAQDGGGAVKGKVRGLQRRLSSSRASRKRSSLSSGKRRPVLAVRQSTGSRASPMDTPSPAGAPMHAASPTINTRAALKDVYAMFNDSPTTSSFGGGRLSRGSGAGTPDTTTGDVPFFAGSLTQELDSRRDGIQQPGFDSPAVSAAEVSVVDSATEPPAFSIFSDDLPVRQTPTTGNDENQAPKSSTRRRRALGERSLAPAAAAAAANDSSNAMLSISATDISANASHIMQGDCSTSFAISPPTSESSHASGGGHAGDSFAHHSDMQDPFCEQTRSQIMKAAATLQDPNVVKDPNQSFIVDAAAILSGEETDIEVGPMFLHVESSYQETSHDTIIAAQDLDEDRNVTLVLSKPPNVWPFHMSTRLSQRLISSTSNAFLLCEKLFVFNNASVSIWRRSTVNKNLATVLQAYAASETMQAMPEELVMHYACDMFRLLSLLHQANILHGRLDASCFVLRPRRNAGGGGGGADRTTTASLMLDVHNATIDRNDFDRSMQFRATDAKHLHPGLSNSVTAVLSAGSWTTGIDTLSVADVLHRMLHGINCPLDVVHASGRLAPRKEFAANWQAKTWSHIFDSLLNPEPNTPGGSSAVTFTALRQNLESFLAQDASRAAAIETALRKQNRMR